MIDLNLLKKHATLAAPANPNAIAVLGEALGISVANDYLDLLAISNGLLLERHHADGFTTEVRIYPAEEVLEANMAFDIGVKAPAHFLIGDSGGYYGVLLGRTSPRLPVYVEDLHLDYINENPPVSKSFTEWISLGFPLGSLDDEAGIQLPDSFDIQLVALPKGGQSGLIALKSRLGIEAPIAKLFQETKKLPCHMLRNVSRKYAIIAAEICDEDPCLVITEAGNADKKFPPRMFR